MVPQYKNLSPADWRQKRDFFRTSYSPCRLCPRQCAAVRENNQPGACQALKDVKIAAHNLHGGEEPPISGSRGSGTIFFSGCTLKCLFCQNYPLSQLFHGEFYSISQLAAILLALQKRGAHNINLVSPTPYLHHLLAALEEASGLGLAIPLVYNTSGYERTEVIAQLRGIVDIYLPDFKYGPGEDCRQLGLQLSAVGDYYENAFAAIREMYGQTGPLSLDDQGVAVRGTIIRHLIIPGRTDNSLAVLQAIAAGPLRDIHLSLMSQYFPAHRASGCPPFDRRLQAAEYRQVKEAMLFLGIENGWFQDLES
jgi:putative pyruvate formate lyase activating enzyme